jgi:hypothetical protein
MLEIGVAPTPTLKETPPETALLAVVASSRSCASSAAALAGVGLGKTYDVYVGLYPGMLTQ